MSMKEELIIYGFYLGRKYIQTSIDVFPVINEISKSPKLNLIAQCKHVSVNCTRRPRAKLLLILKATYCVNKNSIIADNSEK